MNEDTKLTTKNPSDGASLNKFALFRSWIPEVFSLFFWTYIVVKVFIYDIDTYVIEKFIPQFGWVIQYKFLLLLGGVSLIWLFARKKKILLGFLYVCAYPLILFFWKIPSFFYKTGGWSVVIALLNLVFSFFASLKSNVVGFSFFVISTVLILTSENKIVLLSTSVIILILLIFTFINRFKTALRPSLIYRTHSKFVNKILEFTKKTWVVDAEIKEQGITYLQMSDSQLQKWSNNLQMSVIANRVCYFLSSKLKEYQKSKTSTVLSIFGILTLLFFTVVCFGLIALALYKSFPDAYIINSIEANFFGFFFLSFNTFVFNNINEISVASNYSRVLMLIEQSFALILTGLFISLILPLRNERESSEMNDLVNKIKDHGDDMGQFIESEYNLTVEDAIKKLEDIKAVLVKFILYLTRNIGN